MACQYVTVAPMQWRCLTCGLRAGGGFAPWQCLAEQMRTYTTDNTGPLTVTRFLDGAIKKEG